MWFRRDLRLLDNPAVAQSAKHDRLTYLYCLDPNEVGSDATLHYTGASKTGPHRLRLLAQSLDRLRKSLRANSNDLRIAWGRAEDVLARIPDVLPFDAVFYGIDVTSKERIAEARVMCQMEVRGLIMKPLWNAMTLYDAEQVAGGWCQPCAQFYCLAKCH
jgi:deoxyribodipyrimidine photolyase